MTDQDSPSPEPDPSDIDAIRADIEQTRAELADTVEQVIGKLDVKAQVGDKAESAKHAAADRAAQVKAAAPAPVRSALDSIGGKAGPPAQRAGKVIAPYRGKIVAGTAVGIVMLLVVRRRRNGSS